MNRILPVTIAILLLASVAATVYAVEVAKANFFHPTQPMPYLTISSPKNQVYSQSVVPFKTMTFCSNSSIDDTGVKFGTIEEIGIHFETLKWLNYTIDGQVHSLDWTFPPNTYSGVNNTLAWYSIPYVSYTDTNLTHLSDGEHYLSVYGETIFNAPVFANISFIIDTTPPTITIISPQNNTYRSTSIPLNFTVNEPTTQISYSLDNQANITVLDNTTLTDVTNGDHILTLYTNDAAGNMATSDTVFFTITAAATFLPTPTNSPAQQPTIEPTQTISLTPTCVLYPAPSNLTIIIAIVIGVSIVTCASILVYFKNME